MQETDYELRIRPTDSWVQIGWAEVFAYRELLWQFVRRDFTSKFKQTILGPVWYIVNPLITTVVFAIIFGKVLGASPEGIPALLFFNAGLLAWNYFANVLSATGNTLNGNVHIFSKVYFPRLIVPFAQAISNLIPFAVQLITFLVLTFYVYLTDPNFRNLNVGWWILFLPLLVLHIAVLALGGGLLMSALTTKYRDLQNVLGFVVSSMMFVTPVMWPLEILKAKFPNNFEVFLVANPLIEIVEGFRLITIGVGAFSLHHYAISVVISVAIFIAGISLFQRAARTYVDVA